SWRPATRCWSSTSCWRRPRSCWPSSPAAVPTPSPERSGAQVARRQHNGHAMSAPPELHTLAASYLDAGDGLSADRRETFALRLDRFWGDLRDAVVGLHPDPAVSGPLLERLGGLGATAYAARPDDPHRLDLQPLLP